MKQCREHVKKIVFLADADADADAKGLQWMILRETNTNAKKNYFDFY